MTQALLSIVIPCYNEEVTIGKVVRDFNSPMFAMR